MVSQRLDCLKVSRTSGSPTMTTEPQQLVILPETLAVCRLAVCSPIPPWATAGRFFSITRTPEELSIVTRQDLVPVGINCEPDWRCLRVAGTLPFTAVGILAGATSPLAAAGISVFVVSTFDTDYLFVKAADLNRACAALSGHGHMICAE
jgi:hypothetical protein